MKTITSPIKNNIFGFFPYESDYNEIIKQYLKNLLSTNYGEIPMKNEYGIKYWSVFGENGSDDYYIFKKHIEDQITRYCPECSVQTLSLTKVRETLTIELSYKIIKTNDYDNIVIQVGKWII